MEQMLLFDIDKYTLHEFEENITLRKHKPRADYSGVGIKCVNNKVIIERGGRKVIDDYEDPTSARQIAEMYKMLVTLKTLGS